MIDVEVFACSGGMADGFSGKTKRARWSQIGQAMPPPLAHAVAGSRQGEPLEHGPHEPFVSKAKR